MAGTTKGKLDGIPIGHKDIYNTAVAAHALPGLARRPDVSAGAVAGRPTTFPVVPFIGPSVRIVAAESALRLGQEPHPET